MVVPLLSPVIVFKIPSIFLLRHVTNAIAGPYFFRVKSNAIVGYGKHNNICPAQKSYGGSLRLALLCNVVHSLFSYQ